ncbi:uncharacterized protein A1O9_02446 [Exophiala aquamarina CBS 119918]|uniref:Uncharacterized protein n=1 Tax=Exophiala aquamarina CBS 119918 TaxID=1182545 RepID=A0A072PNH4_9EURO|nr:uncharacterized protein A1O9_02446 [Exophiala aquamarina CBS 119918]KEF60883.1 hypothetical protein A1O9_02446 [Exophiala aquamarina CBS 119918]
MAWYSILPSHLTVYETWIIRAFIILAIINIAPWILALLYDLLYYIFRRIWHEIPIWGGRARGEHRPRAPSLRDRNRRMSFRDIVTGGSSGSGDQNTNDGAGEFRRRSARHQKSLSSQSIEEEGEDDVDGDIPTR